MSSHAVGRGNTLNKAIEHGEKLRASDVETRGNANFISFCDSPVCILKMTEALPSKIDHKKTRMDTRRPAGCLLQESV